MNKKIQSIVGIGTVLIIAIIIGLFFLLSNKNIPPTEQANIKEDRIVINEEFSKDNNGVYQSNDCLPEEDLIKLDPKTFEVLNSCFIKDKNGVYYKPFCGQDCLYKKHPADTLSLIDLGDGFLKDKNYIYYAYQKGGDKIIKNADSNTFEKLNGKFTKDKNNLYYEDIIVANIDINSIEVIDDNQVKDSKNIYNCISDIYGPSCKAIK